MVNTATDKERISHNFGLIEIEESENNSLLTSLSIFQQSPQVEEDDNITEVPLILTKNLPSN